MSVETAQDLFTTDATMTVKLSGNVITGLGKGAIFTELDWAKKQFIDKLGIDPHPGTLNIHLTDDRTISNWQTLHDTPAYTIYSTNTEDCDARCYPVYIANQYTGAIVLPLIENYPADQIEIITPIPLRQSLSLQDGDPLIMEFNHPVKASTIIFDLDGTLVDTVEAFYVLAKRTGDEFGINMIQSHVYNSLNHGMSYWDSVLPQSTPNRQATIDQLNNRAVQLWPEVIAEHARIFPDIFNSLITLKETGITLGIVTGSGEASLELLYSAGVRELFDAVISGADVANRKPHPEGLVKCLDVLGADAADSVYVGDTIIDMQASRAAGMTAIAVLSGAGDSVSLCEAGAYRIIHSHGDLIDLMERK